MPSAIREFAPAKVNLALHVLGRRLDGYHDIDSVVAFADVGDVLELRAAERTTLTIDGPFAAELRASADNLVLKAHAVLSQRTAVPAISFRLTKNLPIASGIGGGSADAAAALRGILRLADIALDDETSREVALSLGADVPVCLYGKSCRMQGVGEVITPVHALPAKAIVLANPLLACGTSDVFKTMGLKAGDVSGAALDLAEPATWRNDMSKAALKVLPIIGDVLAALSQLPKTKVVRMSGSGATCFALFDEYADAELATQFLRGVQPQWWSVAARLV